MSAEDRRRAVVDATLPLLRTHGTDVSTRQIAEAAGVAEGTLFRVFASKDELIAACLTEAMSPGRLQADLDAARADTLAATVAGVLTALDRHNREMRALMGVLPHVFPHPGACERASDTCRRPDAAAIRAGHLSRLATLLDPFAAELAHPVPVAVEFLLAVSFGAHHPMVPTDDVLDPALLARLALGGLTREG